MHGKFIVFEGGEGAGKSTQVHQLQAWLLASAWGRQQRQSLPGSVPVLIVTREPGGTVLGEQLRGVLLGTDGGIKTAITDTAELLMYAADRAQHVEGFIRPHLRRGTMVICDRYTASTIAYQGYGRGLDLELIDQLNHIATGGLTSDLTLWLDLDVQIGLTRVRQRNSGELQVGEQYDRMEAEEVAFHERLRAGFAAVAAQAPERVVRIDASENLETVATQIQAVVSQRLAVWYPNLLLQ